MNKTLVASILALGTLAAGTAFGNGPVYDASGNPNLNGTYYFRQVVYLLGDTAGDLTRAIAFNGTFQFHGDGTYVIPAGATLFDDNDGQESSQTTTLPISGTYTLAASGLGYMSSPLNGFYGLNDSVYFTLGSGGVIVASSTENNYGYNDILIAALQSSPAHTASDFSGTWTMAGYLPAVYEQAAGAESVFFQMNPNGAGSLGTVSVTGYIGAKGPVAQTQTSNNVTYTFSSGAAVLTFPNLSNSTPYYSGKLILNFSADGNFVFGGMNGWFDMIVGVRNGSQGAAQNFSGIYFQAGIDQDFSQYATSGLTDFDTYYGSLNATASGVILVHTRLQDVFNNATISQTFTDSYSLPAVSPYTDAATSTQYAYGSNGLYRIGAGSWPFFGLTVAVQAPVLSGSGVFINPDGVVNAASSAPFTAGVSPGELVVIYGNNLASGLVVSPTVRLPTTLGNGVQVLVNGVPAAIYYVSSTQIAFIMPFNYAFSVAPIQVTNAAGSSNTVTEFVYQTTPGMFTIPPGGNGNAAVYDTNTGQIVSALAPANPGDTIEAFLTGLGGVTPSPPYDGDPGPVPPANTVNTISADIGGTTATVGYAGLAPEEAALYQVNITLPTTLAGGDMTLGIAGTLLSGNADSYTTQAVICVSGAPCGVGGSDRKASQRARQSAHALNEKGGHSLKRMPAVLTPIGR